MNAGGHSSQEKIIATPKSPPGHTSAGNVAAMAMARTQVVPGGVKSALRMPNDNSPKENQLGG